MSNIAVVVIGYNRINSVKRLITSLQAAWYEDSVDLIISIDYSGTDVVEKYAHCIEWNFGKKIVKTFPERLGLRKHVLTCGNYINEYDYDAIIVLEDDIVVSPGFFNFSKQAVAHYRFNEEIAGISLYSHTWNVTVDRPFIPLYKGYDVFFMQYPQSWGQVWIREQWNRFYYWYESKEYEKMNMEEVPDNVLGWPDSSWLKYHVMYCIAKKKYFVYPFHAFTSNFADIGTHYEFSTNKMQIPMDISQNTTYRMPDSIEDSSIYNSAFENQQLGNALGIGLDSLEVDLYGTLKKYKSTARYLLSSQLKPYKLVKSFGLEMRPWEMNVLSNVPGHSIYLYDITEKDFPPKEKHRSTIHWVYDTRGAAILKRNVVDILWNEVRSRIKRN